MPSFRNPKLKLLMADNNELTGHVPECLTEMRNLQLLRLDGNDFDDEVEMSVFLRDKLRRTTVVL